MEVLNTALYYTKVCLGFSSKHEKVDIPENNKLVEALKDLEDKGIKYDKTVVLLDISRSLAIIADKLSDRSERRQAVNALKK